MLVTHKCVCDLNSSYTIFYYTWKNGDLYALKGGVWISSVNLLYLIQIESWHACHRTIQFHERKKYQMNTIWQLKGDRTPIHEWILSDYSWRWPTCHTTTHKSQDAIKPNSHKMQKNQGIEHNVFKGDWTSIHD